MLLTKPFAATKKSFRFYLKICVSVRALMRNRRKKLHNRIIHFPCFDTAISHAYMISIHVLNVGICTAVLRAERKNSAIGHKLSLYWSMAIGEQSWARERKKKLLQIKRLPCCFVLCLSFVLLALEFSNQIRIRRYLKSEYARYMRSI